MTSSWSASCRCGALRVQLASPAVLQLVCHCTDCRAVAGTPFSNFVFFRARDAQDFLSELQNGHLRRVANVDGFMKIALGQPKNAVD